MDQTVCCYRHRDRETGVRCSRCDRPICPECMVNASVGFHCPECAGGSGGGSRSAGAARDNRPRTIAGGVVTANPRLVTIILIGINLAVFLAVQARGALVADLALNGPAVAHGQYYRLLTAVFLHQAVPHIALNMLSLWWIGPSVEAALGRTRYLALYLLAGLGGSALSVALAPWYQYGLGASGAIFGLLGAMFVLMRRLRYSVQPIVILIALNLLFTFTWPGIDWRAHVGGLVTGAVVAYGMVHAPRDRRAAVQWGTSAVVLAAIVAVSVVGVARFGG